MEGHWGGLGGSRGSKGACLTPLGHFFAPLEALYSTKFSSKHHIMVQLANVYKAGINDPFLDLWGPLWKLSKGHFLSKQAILRLKIVLNPAFWPLKWSSACPNWPNLVQDTPCGWSPQVERILYPIYAFFGVKNAKTSQTHQNYNLR